MIGGKSRPTILYYRNISSSTMVDVDVYSDISSYSSEAERSCRPPISLVMYVCVCVCVCVCV